MTFLTACGPLLFGLNTLQHWYILIDITSKFVLILILWNHPPNFDVRTTLTHSGLRLSSYQKLHKQSVCCDYLLLW